MSSANQKRSSGRNGSPREVPLRLEKVLGLTSLSNAALTSNTKGDLFYSAGSVSVSYNAEENQQSAFFHTSADTSNKQSSNRNNNGANSSNGSSHNNRPISSQTVSPCNTYLAIGERGHQPAIKIWHIEKNEKIATLYGHKQGVGCMAFSYNSKFLVSAGFKHDRQCIVWAWMDDSNPVAILKLNNKVFSVKFQYNKLTFTTCGDRHLKWWNIEVDGDGEFLDCVGRPASITEDQRDAIFMDACFGIPPNSSPTADSLHTYCITFKGMICMFNNSSRMMDNWVQLESPSSFSLCLFAFNSPIPSLSINMNPPNKKSVPFIPSDSNMRGILFVGCADGIVRAFNPDTLDYLATLPLPSALPDDGVSSVSYPACYAICKISMSPFSPVPKIATIYADHSMFIWDVSDVLNALVYKSFMNHHGCVWDVQFIEGDQKTTTHHNSDCETEGILPRKSFITCSSDNTIRFWNTDGHSQRNSKWRSPFSNDMLHCIDVIPPSSFTNTSPASSPSFDDGHNSSTSFSSNAIPITSRPIVSLSQGMPDFELPDKQQVNNAPRSLSVEPLLGHLAVGDKSGRLRIFDLRTMEEVVNIQAHAAEILTLNYSPPMRCSSVVAEGNAQTNKAASLWTTDSESAGNDQSSQPLILLVTAGRDRLIHVFEAKKFESPGDGLLSYRIIHTLDNHSSSVTTVRFTSDGQRLLSCGGDRTLVFSKVNGPEITRIKSVQTPHGSINGLAVETTNKFAVTSGQDKRVNIWNVQSGKLMRAYKSESVMGELYKSDVDPSGIFVCSCAFDKTINLFDFFSGDLISQVYGHSELVTGVRFSPDGRNLVSIGGDGCVMVWRVGDSLVNTMQDRLMELYSNVQRKQTKVTNAVLLRQSQQLSLPPVPPPLPAETEYPPSTSTIRPQPSGSTGNDSLSSVHPPLAPANNNRWVSRISDEAGGSDPSYEIFGKKIVVGDNNAQPDRNKFTLDFSETAATNSKSLRMLATNGNPSELATTMEADDHVVCSGLSDDDDDDVLDSDSDDDGKLFKPLPEGESAVGDDVDGNNPADFDDDDLNAAKSKVDSLEKSVQDLEDWLENMLRDESRLDDAVIKSAVVVEVSDKGSSPRAGRAPVSGIQSENPEEASDMLGKSISSQFFSKLRKSVDTAIVIGKEHSIMRSIEQPPSSVSAASEGLALEVKRRETAAAVAQMKSRLKSMGILESTLTNPYRPKEIIDGASKSSSMVSMEVPAHSVMPPAPPPTNATTTTTTMKAAGIAESGSGFAGTVTDSNNNEDASANIAPKRESAGASSLPPLRSAIVGSSPARLPTNIKENRREEGIVENNSLALAAALQDNELKVQQTASKCRAALSALDAAKQAAMASFQDFLSVQADLAKPLSSSSVAQVSAFPYAQSAMPSSSSSVFASSDSSTLLPVLNMEESVIMQQRAIATESEKLMREFRQSFESLNEYSNMLLKSLAVNKSLSPPIASDGTNRSDQLTSFAGGMNASSSSSSSIVFNLTSSSNQISPLDVSVILEKYSDKLVELIADKMAAAAGTSDKLKQ